MQSSELSVPAYQIGTESKSAFLRGLAANHWLHLILLVALVFYCFARTLGSYFLADDFGEISYVSKIFHGHPEMLIANWIGPYIHNLSIKVYRPWMHMSQVFDFSIWKTNAFGFYLTNLLYFIGDVILTYFLSLKLFYRWGKDRSAWAALFIAGLFATSPLHCESVSWMVGRVDVICCFYYLLSLFLFIGYGLQDSKHKKLFYSLGVLSYWLALLTKEMAIGLPVVLTCFAFMWGKDLDSTTHSFKNRLSTAFQLTYPVWLSTVIYFVIRYLCLGTLLGGYTGDIAAAQSSSILTHWMDKDNLFRLVMPFNYFIFGSGSIYQHLAIGCYCLIAALTFVRLLLNTMPWKWLAFLGAWILTTLVPIYQLWGLGYNLEGGRFCFFLTVPLSFILPLLIFYPVSTDLQLFLGTLQKRVLAIGSFALLLLIATFAITTYKTNLLWVHAGKEVRSFSNRCQALAKDLPDRTQAIILGIPKDHGGAHMILNSETFRMMLEPPFLKESIANKFIVFDPLFYGSAQYINASRFKNVLDLPTTKGVFLWSSKDQNFLPVNLSPKSPKEITSLKQDILSSTTQNNWLPYTLGHLQLRVDKDKLVASDVLADDGLILSGLELNPTNVDFLECKIKAAVDGTVPISASWSNNHNIDFNNNIATETIQLSKNSFQIVRIRLSHYWRWFASGTIRQLVLNLFPAKQIEIKDIRFIQATEVVPQANISNVPSDEAGVFILKNKPLNLKVDGSKIADCTQLRIEISKPNFFFDNANSNIQSSMVSKEILIPSKTANISIDASTFPKKAFYQLRIHCLSNTKAPIGEYSDPITINCIKSEK